MTALVSLADLTAAATRIAPVAVRTPLLPFDVASETLGADIWLKPEMLQRGGAFKFRGAYNFLAQLSPEERARGVVAPSSGNHAQAVALAARLFGVTAVVVMPTTVTDAKRAGAERLGARVELAGTNTQHRMDRAMELMEAEGLTMVPPYDHPWIIAGQGTAGLEIADDMADVGMVLVPVGGGGLSAGVATAIKLRAPTARVIGVEPAGAPKLSRARAAGAPVRLPSTSGLADGLLAVEIGGEEAISEPRRRDRRRRVRPPRALHRRCRPGRRRRAGRRDAPAARPHEARRRAERRDHRRGADGGNHRTARAHGGRPERRQHRMGGPRVAPRAHMMR
jgi:threonine dehydratase